MNALTLLMNLVSISGTTSTSGVHSQNSGSSLPPLYALPTASGFSFAFGLLLGIILSMFIMKMQARRKAIFSARKEVPLQVPAPVYEELATCKCS